jgi:hypothetical protein
VALRVNQSKNLKRYLFKVWGSDKKQDQSWAGKEGGRSGKLAGNSGQCFRKVGSEPIKRE